VQVNKAGSEARKKRYVAFKAEAIAAVVWRFDGKAI